MLFLEKNMAKIFALIGFVLAFFIDFNLRWFPFSVFYFGIFVIWRMKNLILSKFWETRPRELGRFHKYFNDLCNLLQILGIFLLVAVFLDILKVFDYAYQIFAICSTTITFYTLGASIRLLWIMQAQGKENKTPETFDFEDLLKKQKQNAKAINSIHEAISKADKIVIIYSKDLLDELYFERKILDIIKKKLKDGVKIVFLSNEENKASRLIRWYLYTENGIKINYLSKNEELLYIDNVGEIPCDFIMADKQYIRVEFCRKEHISKFYNAKNKDESEEAQRWIDMTYNILTNNIINKLEKEGRLEQVNKLKEFIELKI